MEPNCECPMKKNTKDKETTNVDSIESDGNGDDTPDANKDRTGGLFKRVVPGGDIPLLSTALDATEYFMNHPHRGTLLLFNQKNFNFNLNVKLRNGTDVDRDNVQSQFEKLGFNVKVFNDLKYQDIKYELTKAAKDDHSQNDCFACVMLTHGDEGLLYSQDAKFKNTDLWTPFLADVCPTLAGKPKLFFIQACQGTSVDAGQKVKGRIATDSLQVVKIPAHADFLIACSTVPGYYSWRNTTSGSWFIQALCMVLSNHHKMDLLSMMTVVNHTVAYHFQSCVPFDPDMNEKKQIPYICSMLTRKVFLHSK